MKTKKRLNIAFATAGLFLGLSVAAEATTIGDTGLLDYIGQTPGASSGSGGEFSWDNVNGGLDLSSYSDKVLNQVSTTSGWTTFQSFCLEHNEFISGSDEAYIVNNGAHKGNTTGGDNPDGDTMGQLAVMPLFPVAAPGDPIPDGDILSAGVGYLFSQFAKGTLAGYDYTGSGRSSDAGQLQKAFWYLEHEITATALGSNKFIDLLLGAGGFNANSMFANGGGDYGVYALNMGKEGNRQDMLYFNAGDPSTGVPDSGSTVLLLGLGLVGLWLVRRRLVTT